jgi:hypothetical protein
MTEMGKQRYSAFSARGGRHRLFRIWHPPWRRAACDARLDDLSLLAGEPWMALAEPAGACYSPGLEDVWVGRPRRFWPGVSPGR